MADMSHTIVAKSDQMNADDLIGGPLTVTITRVDVRTGDQPVSIHVKEWPQPWKPCKTMRRLLIAGWGPDPDVYTGRRLTLFRNPDVRWSGQPVGGIEFSHMSHITKPVELALQVTKGQKKRYTVNPLETIVTAADAAAMQKRWLAATKAAGLTPTKQAFEQFVVSTTGGRIVAADAHNAKAYTPALLSACDEAIATIGQPDATETNRQHEPYAAILARINAAPNGQQANDIAEDIRCGVESGELTSDEANELQSKLSAAMN